MQACGHQSIFTECHHPKRNLPSRKHLTFCGALHAACGLNGRFLALCRKMVREDGVDVFVELDVGSDYNNNDEQIRSVLYNVVEEGAIASYVTSVQGFQFRRLGEGKMLR